VAVKGIEFQVAGKIPAFLAKKAKHSPEGDSLILGLLKIIF